MPFSIRKKGVVFLIIFLSLFFSANFSLAKKCTTDDNCPGYKEGTTRCLETEPGKKECVRALEIVYPKIADQELTVEKVAKEGLPGYLKYLFTLSVALLGLVILGVLIYNGFLYLTSAGKPEQMSEARKGIISAFLGGVILLSSVLIFNTINPQLKIMELAKVPLLGQVVVPGIYICNYPVDKEKLKTALNDYIDEKGEKTEQERNEAVKKLREIIWNPKTEQGCPRVNFSGNFQNFKVTATGNTIFIVPSISIDPKTKKRIPKYEYGIVLHENDNFGGQCFYYPNKDPKNPGADDPEIYRQIDDYSAKDLPFTAYSVTLFQKPPAEPVGDGVTLYNCFNYNREGKCDGEPPPEKSYHPGHNDTRKIDSNKLGVLKDNSRSISFSPTDSFFALLYEGNFTGRCKLLRKNNPNLLDVLPKPITAECKTGFWAIIDIFHWGECKPLLGSMIVIKGTPL